MCYVMLGVMVSNLRSFLSAAIHTYIKDFFFNSNNFISVANPCSNYGALPEPDPIYFNNKIVRIRLNIFGPLKTLQLKLINNLTLLYR